MMLKMLILSQLSCDHLTRLKINTRLDLGPILLICLPWNSALTYHSIVCYKGSVSAEFCGKQSLEIGPSKLTGQAVLCFPNINTHSIF